MRNERCTNLLYGKVENNNIGFLLRTYDLISHKVHRTRHRHVFHHEEWALNPMAECLVILIIFLLLLHQWVSLARRLIIILTGLPLGKIAKYFSPLVL